MSDNRLVGRRRQGRDPGLRRAVRAASLCMNRRRARRAVVCMAARSTEAEVDTRVEEVMGLMVDGCSRTDICEYARKNWGVGRSEADRYAQRAREAMRTWHRDSLEERATLSAARHERLYRLAVVDGDYNAAERILKDMDDLQGLRNGAAYQQEAERGDADGFWGAMSAYGSAIRDTCSPEQVTAIVTKANALGAAFNIGNVPKEHPIDPDVERVLRQAAIDKRELGHTRTREELIEAGVIDPRRLDLPPGM